MRILCCHNLLKLKKETDLILKEKKYKEIFTIDGIFIVNEKNIKKIKIIDEPLDIITINNINFYFDKSKIIYEKEEFSIPFDYKINNICEKNYKLLPKSKTSFVEKYKDNKLIDSYFEIFSNDIDYIIVNEIEEYMKLFN